MITKIELGSFNRDASSPIFLKEKIESDGSLSIRIYQRKDIDSINSFKDKIKTMVKYGIEDFCMAHQIFRPLLGTVGVKRIDHLQTDDLQNAPDLFQSIRSEARIGKVTEEKEIKLKKILGNHGLSDDYKIDFYEGKYKDADFFSDLKKFISSDRKFLETDEYWINKIEIAFKSKKIVGPSELEIQQEVIEKIKKSLNKHFQKQIDLAATQPSEGINSSETGSSGSRLSYLTALQTELERKLNNIESEVTQRANTPEDEDIKNHLLSWVEELCSKRGPDAVEEEAEVSTAINILFSTSWWISKERKQESLEKVKRFIKLYNIWLPDPVKARIYEEG